MDSKSEASAALATSKSAAASASAASVHIASAASKKRKSDAISADDAIIVVTQEGNVPDVYTVPISLLPPELLDDKFVDKFPTAATKEDQLAVERIWSFLGTSNVSEDDEDFTGQERNDLQTLRDASPCVKADHPVGIRKAGLVIILAGFA